MRVDLMDKLTTIGKQTARNLAWNLAGGMIGATAAITLTTWPTVAAICAITLFDIARTSLAPQTQDSSSAASAGEGITLGFVPLSDISQAFKRWTAYGLFAGPIFVVAVFGDPRGFILIAVVTVLLVAFDRE